MGDRYLILSLDGSGVRGAYRTRRIERIEAAYPFLHKVELIAGSSISGVNTMSLRLDSHHRTWLSSIRIMPKTSSVREISVVSTLIE